jgi:hypothetical protein
VVKVQHHRLKLTKKKDNEPKDNPHTRKTTTPQNKSHHHAPPTQAKQ